MTDDLELDRPLTADEQEFAGQLGARRPLPGPGFRGVLGRHLAAVDPGYGPRPIRLRLLVGGYVVAAVLLMGLGLLQAAGAL